MTRTMAIEQADLFGAARRVGVITVAHEPTPAPARKRRVRASTAKAHDQITPKAPTIDERCRWEVNGNSTFGRTRQEIADRAGIKLQTVCGAVHRLIKAGKCFEPIVGYDANRRPIHYTRDGRNVVVSDLFRDFDWLGFGQRTGKVTT
jgi:hypothetical protein